LSEQKDFLADHEDREAVLSRLQQQFDEQQAVLLSQIEDLKKACAEYRTDAEHLRRWRRVRQKIAPDGSIRHLALVIIRGTFEGLSQKPNGRPHDSQLILKCEQPDLGTSAKISGISCVHGWAWPRESVERIEVLIDGTHLGDAFYGFARPDVIQSHPNRGDEVHLGFAFRIDTSVLSAGKHQLKIVALGKKGESVSVEGSIEVILQQINQNPRLGKDNSPSGTGNGTRNFDHPLVAGTTSANAAPVDGSK
jgi:hypothetical protein